MISKKTAVSIDQSRTSVAKFLIVCPSWCLILISGILLGLNAPGRRTQFLGMISLFPFFLLLDRVVVHRQCGWRKAFATVVLSCFGTGSIAALLGVPWLTHAAHVFGQLPWVVGYLITAVGYGLEVALVLFICFALPMMFIRRRTWWDIPVRLCFFLMVEPFCPRLFHWSFGGLTFTGFPWISQLADVIGASGLGVYNIGFSLLAVLMWRCKVEKLPIPRRAVRGLVFGYLLSWGMGIAYGVWKVEAWQASQAEGAPLHLIALQPNISFQQLRSNALDYSARERTLRELLDNSIHALDGLPESPSVSKVVIWPESTYPAAYFKEDRLRLLVNDFARRYETSILFHSVDWDMTAAGRQFYGVAVLVGPDGKVRGRYDKIFRIPFGEYIPGARIFPSYAQWVRKHIPNISEFHEGKEFTVLDLSNELRVCAPICFDSFSPTIIRNMARNGAMLVINLSNLIWFGNTTASEHLEMALRWKAIENRVPVLLVSNNGKSLFIDALGMDAGKRLGLFEKGYLSHSIFLQERFSFYREYTHVIHLLFVLLFIVSTVLAAVHGRIFDKK